MFGMVLVVAVLLFIFRKPLSERVAELLNPDETRRPFVQRAVQTRDDLVTTVDGFLLWTFGTHSKWWNARAFEKQLASEYPGHRDQIHDLARSYQKARYAPDSHRLSDQELAKTANTISALVSEAQADADK